MFATFRPRPQLRRAPARQLFCARQRARVFRDRGYLGRRDGPRLGQRRAARLILASAGAGGRVANVRRRSSRWAARPRRCHAQADDRDRRAARVSGLQHGSLASRLPEDSTRARAPTGLTVRRRVRMRCGGGVLARIPGRVFLFRRIPTLQLAQCVQRFAELLQQVAAILDPHGDAHESVADAGDSEFVFRHFGVRGRRRVTRE
jgi:hypothetical protein